jgi:hypothetical protein
MLNIWLVTSFMIVSFALSDLIGFGDGLFELYYIVGSLFVSGFFSFIILAAKCKRVRVVSC